MTWVYLSHVMSVYLMTCLSNLRSWVHLMTCLSIPWLESIHLLTWFCLSPDLIVSVSWHDFIYLMTRVYHFQIWFYLSHNLSLPSPYMILSISWHEPIISWLDSVNFLIWVYDLLILSISRLGTISSKKNFIKRKTPSTPTTLLPPYPIVLISHSVFIRPQPWAKSLGPPSPPPILGLLGTLCPVFSHHVTLCLLSCISSSRDSMSSVSYFLIMCFYLT